MDNNQYKKTFDKLKISENFQERTMVLLKQQKSQIKKERTFMNRNIVKWGGSAAACMVLAAGIFVWNGSGKTEDPITPPATESPVTAGMMAVNIDGIIDEVSADGQSFRIGDLWITVNEDTLYGISEPTAPPLDEQLVSKEFKAGNVVSGFTSGDVTSGQVLADIIYNNFSD